MSEADSQSEPSMEEILASIRRIISDDDEKDEAQEDSAAEETAESEAAEAEAAAEPEPEAEPEADEEAAASEEEDVLDLTEVVQEEEASDAAESEPADDEVELIDTDDEGEAAVAEADMAADAAPAEPVPAPALETIDSLLAPATVAAATTSLAEVARQAGSGRDQGHLLGGGRSLEDVVRDALMPELKVWLDNNLAALVERIVREEIKKMVRRIEDQ